MLNEQELGRLKRIIGDKDEKLSVIFSALSDASRCYIFRSFLKRKEFCVSDIAKVAEISMPSASQHLKILEMRGLISKERRGRVIYYTLNRTNPIVSAIVKAVNQTS